MAIIDYLVELGEIKTDIKQALIDKGVSPSNDFKTYANDIANLNVGGGGDGSPDLSNAIYCEGGAIINNTIELKEGWNIITEDIPSPIVVVGANLRKLIWYKNTPIDPLSPNGRTFFKCPKLNHLELTGWNTSNVTDMSFMFAGYSSMQFLNIRGFDTSNVTNMNYMFSNCMYLTYLDISNIDIPFEGVGQYFFENCELLRTLVCENTNFGHNLIYLTRAYTFSNESIKNILNAREAPREIVLHPNPFSNLTEELISLAASVGCTLVSAS